MMALFNKTRPGLFHRIDEHMGALHPPMLEDLPALDAIARREVYHCNVCGQQCETFGDFDTGAYCLHCGAGRRARALHRALAESTLLYRRLPALGVNVPRAINKFWREQFQGRVYEGDELTQKLSEKGRTDFPSSRLQLVMLNCSPEADLKEDTLLLSETARILAPGGTLMIAGSDAISTLTPRLKALGFDASGAKRYASSVSHYDWLPILLYTRKAAAQ